MTHEVVESVYSAKTPLGKKPFRKHRSRVAPPRFKQKIPLRLLKVKLHEMEDCSGKRVKAQGFEVEGLGGLGFRVWGFHEGSII